jgi:hypothetical protein
MSELSEISQLVRCSGVGAVVDHSPDLEIMDDDYVVRFDMLPQHNNTILVVLREVVPISWTGLPHNQEAVRFFRGSDDDMIP